MVILESVVEAEAEEGEVVDESLGGGVAEDVEVVVGVGVGDNAVIVGGLFAVVVGEGGEVDVEVERAVLT